MITKVAIALAAQLALAALAASAADQAPAELAPGESRSVFNQGAVGRLRQIFGTSDEADQGATRAPRRATAAPRRVTTRTGRPTTRTATRATYGHPGLLSRPRTASRRTAPVEEITTSENATESATSESQPRDVAAAAQETPATSADESATSAPSIAVPRQQATLGSAPANASIATTNYLPIIRAAQRPVTPQEIATPPSAGEPVADIPRSAPSRLLAAEDQAPEEPFEVGLSPAPRLIPAQPAAEEPAPAPPQITTAAPPAEHVVVTPPQITTAAPPAEHVVVTPPQITTAAPPAEHIVVTPPQMRTTTIVPQNITPALVPQTELEPAPEVAAQPVEPVQPVQQPIASAPQQPARPPVDTTVVAPPALSGTGVLRRVEVPQPAPPAVARLTASMIGPREIFSGDTGIFKVHVVNEGDAPAKDVRVEVRADDALMKTLNVGTIPAKTDVDVEIALSPNKTGSLELRAIVTGGEGAKAVAGSVVFVGKPELSLAIAGPPQLNHGDLKMYTAILNNTGNCDATNVTVLVMLQGEQAQSLPVGIVPVGQTRQVRFELRPEQAGQLSVNAVATADGNVQAVANGAINVVQHDVQLAFEGPRQMRYGEKVVYSLIVKNRGNADAEDLIVNVTLGDSVLDRLYEGTLAAGKEEKISFEVSPSKAGFHALRAVALGSGNIKAATSAQLQVQHGQLEIAVENPSVKFAGAEATYKVRVKNIGDANAEDVLVTAHLPESVKYLGGVDRIEFYEGITWRIGQMTPGQQATFELQCELSAAGEQQIVFSATGGDQLEASQTVTTAVEALADVRLYVADPQGLIPVGQDVVYEIEVHNRGVKPAQNIEVVMQLSELLEPTHVEGASAQLQARGVVFDPIATLAAKATVKLRVTARAKDKGSHQYRVEMSADEPSTFMASEGTTRFYGTSALESSPATTGDE